ncbi:MAG: radical SAM protein [Archaeoglobaceae archaeon]
MQESKFYEKHGEKVKCLLCERSCLIAENDFGICKTRVNLSGRLYTLTYGNLSAMESRPIEIKPFFHYYPGSTSLTFSTWSCNFFCPWCQNYHLSRSFKKGAYVSPEDLVKKALGRDEGVCVSFQEPTLMAEYAIDVFRVARQHNLYACFVSNGYMTSLVLKALVEAGLNGLKIDVKGGEDVYEKFCKGVDVWKVWRNVRDAIKMGVHVEIVNLVVTGVNEKDVDWVIENHLRFAGAEIPIHFTRYFPAYKFSNPPTKIEILEEAVKKARKAGISYAYIGNVHGHKFENTYCPDCNELLIKRYGYRVLDYRLKNKKCPKCGREIKIFGEFVKKPWIF